MYSTIYNFSNQRYDKDFLAERLNAEKVEEIEDSSDDPRHFSLLLLAKTIGLSYKTVQKNKIECTKKDIEEAIDRCDEKSLSYKFITNTCIYDLQDFLDEIYTRAEEENEENITLRLKEVFTYHFNYNNHTKVKTTFDEICPNCNNEIELTWNTKEFGNEIFCPYCQEKVILKNSKKIS